MINNPLFTNAIKTESPKVAFKLIFANETISSDNLLIEASLDFICTSFVGQFPSWKFTAGWLVDGTFKNYENQEFEVQVGAYPIVEEKYDENAVFISLGLFTVPEGQQTTDDINPRIDIVAYDRTQKLNKRYEPLTFGTVGLTGLQIRTQIAQRNGLSFKPTTMKYDSRVFKSLNLSIGQGITDLEVLKQYLMLNMSFASMGRTGLIEVKNVFSSIPITEGLSADYDFPSLKLEGQYGPINSLIYSNKATGDDQAYQNIEAKDEASIIANGKKSLEFNDNIFIDLLTLQEKQLLINDLFTVIKGYKYSPFEIGDLFARPDFDVGDVFKLKNSKGLYFTVPLTSMSFKYNGGLIGSMGTKELPQTLPKPAIPNILERMTNAEIKVNRVENKITLEVKDIREELDDNKNKIEGVEKTTKENAANIALNAQGIQMEATERQLLGERLESEMKAALLLKSDSLSLVISKIANDQALTESELQEFKTYFRWDANGSIIGKDGHPITLHQTNTGIEIRENGSVIAFWEQGTMSVDNLIAKMSIVIGTHLAEKYDSPTVGTTTIWRMI